MKKMLFIIVVLLFAFGSSNAQFTPNNHYLGPCVGLSFLGSTPQFGVNYEYGMDLENFGRVGIGGIFRYWSYSEDFGGFLGSGKWSYTDILIGAQGNYHFKLESNTFDPWVGVTLAYDAGSVSWDGPGGYNYASPTYGGLFFGAQGGARYWFSPTVAVSARLGYGSLSYGALDLGVDFKF
jgi:hypothetical protein